MAGQWGTEWPRLPCPQDVESVHPVQMFCLPYGLVILKQLLLEGNAFCPVEHTLLSKQWCYGTLTVSFAMSCPWCVSVHRMARPML